ncbi:general secretion pathway protein G [Dyella jiangningensis]|uniref:type II secretion system protein n=1 Tax=Dyella sp. AtDHG13 TaxID=1938897 RepID=UPI0008923E88|nr:type II secretion system protein [Dyella sp. AtDHG13]PXV57050.1 general secretion pathway protein G [Dyella sp. AtDHG13]SDK65332.1 general secretion pathway protein G [Dyella jiangningensis]
MTPRGFTLIEMLVTLAILAALASVALPLAQMAAERQREQELKRDLWQIRDAIDDYKKASDEGKIEKSASDSGYPPTLDVLVNGVTDKSSPQGQKLYFLRRIPRDPLCDCPSKSDAQTWGKRSYASPPEAPAEGDDVYDVYSLAQGNGQNGVPFRQW